MTGLRWTHKTTEKIRRQLLSIGIRVSRSTIARLLKQQGYALRANHKQIARCNHEHRDRQFRYITRLRAVRSRLALPTRYDCSTCSGCKSDRQPCRPARSAR